MSTSTGPHFPDFARFCQIAGDADLVPVYRRLVSDSLTPVSAFHKIDAGRCACLFESVVGGEKVGRYSFLATHPFFEIEAYEDRVTVNSPTGISASGAATLVTRQYRCSNPFDELRRHVEGVRAVALPELPPFCSGAVGYAGYDVVRYAENLPDAPPDDRQVPDLAFAFYDQMVVFDHVSKTIVVVAMARLNKPDADSASAYADACRRVDRLVSELATNPCDLQPVDIASEREVAPEGKAAVRCQSNFNQADFQAAVCKCVDYIRAGDIFQVVLSHRMEVPIRMHPFEIYRSLRVVNPSPFMFYVRTPAVTLVGSSPEIMVRVVNGHVTTRPLAGTRRRGATDEEDRRLAEELLADPKELAEHTMLVELGPQRRRPRSAISVRPIEQRHDDRALQPRNAHHVERHRATGRGQDRVRCPPGMPARGHRFRGPESAGDADHRRVGAAPPRTLCGRSRLFRLQWEHGYLYRPANHRSAGG